MHLVDNWRVFLAAFVDLARVKRRRWPDPAGNVLAGLRRTRLQAVLTRLFAGDPSIPPPLEPMLPALAETVLF